MAEPITSDDALHVSEQAHRLGFEAGAEIVRKKGRANSATYLEAEMNEAASHSEERWVPFVRDAFKHGFLTACVVVGTYDKEEKILERWWKAWGDYEPSETVKELIDG